MPPWMPGELAHEPRLVVAAIDHSAMLEAELSIPRVSEVGADRVLECCRAVASSLSGRFKKEAVHG